VLSSLRTGPPAIAHGDLVTDLQNLRRGMKEVSIQLADLKTTTSCNDDDDIGSKTAENLSSTTDVDAVAPDLTMIHPYVEPFLSVVIDPSASGRHTLAALRSLYRLLERGTLVSLVKYRRPLLENSDNNNAHCTIGLNAIAKATIACKFEQTDVAGDEAVEMALADLLGLLIILDSAKLVAIDCGPDVQGGEESTVTSYLSSLQSETRMEAFTTVFVARNTFIHSPALCYHVEGVLLSMVKATFSQVGRTASSGDPKSSIEVAAKNMLEFLTQQLLHTPLLHHSLSINSNSGAVVNNEAQAVHDATRVLCLKLARCIIREGWFEVNKEKVQLNEESTERLSQRTLLSIIQEDLCLALLIIGQASGSAVLSLEVLSEVCATIVTLWSDKFLRSRLLVQFEAIFNGFYGRILAILQRRPVAVDSNSFVLNQSFDSECVIILESLVDIFCLLDESENINISPLESLFVAYDCNIACSDVTIDLIKGLCCCCGSTIASSNEQEGDVQLGSPRQVPGYIRELCAEALIVGLKCLFHNVPLGDAVAQGSNPPLRDGLPLNEIEPDLRQIICKKNLLRAGAMLFNEKSTTGFKLLMDEGVLPSPLTPKDAAAFLRKGITLGLSKVAVGVYLGEMGKASIPLKTYPECERDWFHQKVLREYCNLFHFQSQSLLDGLRMFLSSFRLPGEAQQIDRIIQAFAESCGRQCVEAVDLKLFSDDEKKATDATYLLAFSIIMLNTDLHNDNIRPDRKMSVDAFVRNNSDYGRDVTDEGKPLPREFLESIYESIKMEEIRTEGEGAEGIMTVEQWTDVISGRCGHASDFGFEFVAKKCSDGKGDVKFLVVEYIWKYILRAIDGFWSYHDGVSAGGSNSMLGAQEARLGMDLATELLLGVSNLKRQHIFDAIFASVCISSGLLSYDDGEVSRRKLFIQSVQKQSAVIAAIDIAKRSGNMSINCWKYVFGILFELRDLKLLGSKFLVESDPDLLKDAARKKWNSRMCLAHNRGFGGDNGDTDNSGVFMVFSNIFANQVENSEEDVDGGSPDIVQSVHGKEKLFVWDEGGESDDEISDDHESVTGTDVVPSAGSLFENQLIHEDHFVYFEAPSQDKSQHMTQRARVRKRLAISCDFKALISESRFLTLEGVRHQLVAIVNLIKGEGLFDMPENAVQTEDGEINLRGTFDISPGSEAFAEVLICEIALKNRDRLGQIWDILEKHYLGRLRSDTEDGSAEEILVSPGIEKCVTAVIRMGCRAVRREDITNRVIGVLKLLYPPVGKKAYECLNKHVGEGLWRMCNTDAGGLRVMDTKGWDALLGLIKWCAVSAADELESSGIENLSNDDPSLYAFRCLQFLLHSPDLKDAVPFDVVNVIQAIITSGDDKACPQLSVAALDLLLVLHSRLGVLMINSSVRPDVNDGDCFWLKYWLPVLNCMSDVVEHSKFDIVRHHALSMLTDAIIDSNGKVLSQKDVLSILINKCVNLARGRFDALLKCEDMEEHVDAVNTEFELCLSLIFKPFLHYLHAKKLAMNKRDFLDLWVLVLATLKLLLGEQQEEEHSGMSDTSEHDTTSMMKHVRRRRLLTSTREVASERLQNAIMVLMAYGQIESADAQYEQGSLSDLTWKSIKSMQFCSTRIDEWVLLSNDGSSERVHVLEARSNYTSSESPDDNDRDEGINRIAQ